MQILLLIYFLISPLNHLEIKCEYSTARVRNLVHNEWRSIQKNAKFTVSDKKDFEVTGYRQDGNDLEVDVLSKGFWYDIRFTVSFDDWFDTDCELQGSVISVYNYKKLK
ncbi:MAG: hypothetical protein R2774_13485 [Saprospiraceae bacterium]